jgi:hypothetical protein
MALAMSGGGGATMTVPLWVVPLAFATGVLVGLAVVERAPAAPPLALPRASAVDLRAEIRRIVVEECRATTATNDAMLGW